MTEMVSPFFGGGSIEIHYAAKGVRVHGYDSFEPLVNFWQHVLDDSEGLSYMVEEMFHPCTKDSFRQYQQKQGWTHMDNTHMLWREMRACMYYALNRSSFSGATLSGGYSQQAADKRFTQSSIDRLRNFSCPFLTVKQADFAESLRRHNDETFIYADPPYLLENSTLYGERGSTHKDFDHERFAEEIKKKNNWVISYNPHPEILELYKDYEIVYPEWAYGMHSGKKRKGSTEKVRPKKSQEILILNVKENDDALFIDD